MSLFVPLASAVTITFGVDHGLRAAAQPDSVDTFSDMAVFPAARQRT